MFNSVGGSPSGLSREKLREILGKEKDSTSVGRDVDPNPQYELVSLEEVSDTKKFYDWNYGGTATEDEETDPEFEAKHPRGPDGQFVSKGGGEGIHSASFSYEPIESEVGPIESTGLETVANTRENTRQPERLQRVREEFITQRQKNLLDKKYGRTYDSADVMPDNPKDAEAYLQALVADESIDVGTKLNLLKIANKAIQSRQTESAGENAREWMDLRSGIYDIVETLKAGGWKSRNVSSNELSEKKAKLLSEWLEENSIEEDKGFDVIELKRDGRIKLALGNRKKTWKDLAKVAAIGALTAGAGHLVGKYFQKANAAGSTKPKASAWKSAKRIGKYAGAGALTGAGLYGANLLRRAHQYGKWEGVGSIGQNVRRLKRKKDRGEYV